MKSHSLFIALFFLMPYGMLYGQQADAEKAPYIPYRYKNLWGYCDTLGNIKIEPTYDKVEFVNSTTRLPVVKNKKKSMLDETGKPIIGFYDDFGPISYRADTYWVLNNKKAGIISEKGDTLLPVIYDKIFKPGGELFGKITNRYYFIYFTYSTKPIADTISVPPFSKDPPVFWDPEPKRDPDYDRPPELDRFLVENDTTILTGNKQNLIKKKYNIDSIEKEPYKILRLNNIPEVFYKIYKNRKVGVWSSTHFIYPKYSSIQKDFSFKDYFIVELNKKLGIISKEDKPLVLFKYQKIIPYKDYFIVELNKKLGIISEEGKILAPFKYQKIKYNYNDLLITTINNKQGVMMLGSLYPDIKNIYDKVEFVTSLYSNGTRYFALFRVQKNGKEGFVGENGIEYFKD